MLPPPSSLYPRISLAVMSRLMLNLRKEADLRRRSSTGRVSHSSRPGVMFRSPTAGLSTSEDDTYDLSNTTQAGSSRQAEGTLCQSIEMGVVRTTTQSKKSEHEPPDGSLQDEGEIQVVPR